MLPRYQPMLATPWPQAFDDPDWWFEVKWDGYRTIVYGASGGTELRSRAGNDLSVRYPEVAAMRFDRPVVLDGEVVAFDDQGQPSFFMLGQRPAHLIVFDLLYLDRDRAFLPLEERRALLESMVLPKPAVLNQALAGEGKALFEAVKGQGLEGIVAKRSGSTYQPGRRSFDWRKVAYRRRGKAVVGGYLAGEGERASTFGSLLLGLWDGFDLVFVGSVGSGFDGKTLAMVKQRLADLQRPDSPFTNAVDVPGHKVYVEPTMVVEIEFREWTPYGRLRAPVFKGLSTEPAEAITRDAEAPREPQR
ncbi:MAG: non-homologous end-joining DNA ligase [Actinomycetota bacterium]